MTCGAERDLSSKPLVPVSLSISNHKGVYVHVPGFWQLTLCEVLDKAGDLRLAGNLWLTVVLSHTERLVNGPDPDEPKMIDIRSCTISLTINCRSGTGHPPNHPLLVILFTLLISVLPFDLPAHPPLHFLDFLQHLYLSFFHSWTLFSAERYQTVHWRWVLCIPILVQICQ